MTTSRAAGGQPEGDVRDAKRRLHIRDILLDQAQAFDGFDRAADVILIAGGARENQRIDDDVLRAECRTC